MASDGDIVESVSDDLLVVPAWCDPKNRWVILDPWSVQVGMLAIGPDDLAYATEEGLIFEAKLSQVRVRWRSLLRMTRGCDLDTPQGSYRLYFIRPLRDAPAVRSDQVTTIADGLRRSGGIAQIIGGTLGTIGSVAEIIGNLVELPGAFADERRGRRNADAVRERLGQ